MNYFYKNDECISDPFAKPFKKGNGNLITLEGKPSAALKLRHDK